MSVYGQSFNIEIADHFAFFRYRDQPGMIGRVGSVLGEADVNIISAAVGRGPGEEGDAVMVVTTDAPIAAEVLSSIVESDGFHDGRAVSL